LSCGHDHWNRNTGKYRNIWGGIIGHTLEHATQFATLKHAMRTGLFA
jgi:hypothetical protein